MKKKTRPTARQLEPLKVRDLKRLRSSNLARLIERATTELARRCRGAP